MGWKSFINLTTSGLAITGGVLGTFLTAGNPAAATLITAGLLQALGSLGANFFSSAFQEKFINGASREEILKNGDLIRAVGKAIFTLIYDESKRAEYGEDRKVLGEIANLDEGLWEEIAGDVKEIIFQIEITGNEQITLKAEDLEEISPDNLTRYFTAKGDEINDLTALSVQTWKSVLILFANHQKASIYIKNIERCAERLYKDFPKVLRKILISDFETDGKAYASLQLRIVGETLWYVKDTHKTNVEILAIVQFLADRVRMISELLTDPQIKNDAAFWQTALDLHKSTLETQQEILRTQHKALEYSAQQTNFQEQMVELQRSILKALEGLFSNYQKPAEQVALKLIPSTTFPQPINFFTGRSHVLQEIRETLQKYKTASLFGIHGLGKTSVAIEYCYKSLDDYDQIFFVLANQNDFFSSMAECAANIGLTFPEQLEDEKKAGVFRHWLETKSNFLLILDNVDKVEQVKDYLPTPNRGHILFTSNSPSIRTAGKEVEIKKMEPKEAELLLYRRAKENSEVRYEDIPPASLDIVKQIVSEMGYLPLAINIAGSYIARKQKSFENYLELYQKYSDTLLQEPDKDDPNYKKSVWAAFSLSFDSITTPKDDSENEKFIAAATANCLKSCVFLLPDNMPEEIFRSSTALINDDYSELSANEILWDDVIENLLAYGFFERNTENATFSTHRLIPKITRTKILAEEETELLERLAAAFNGFFPDFDYKKKQQCERYLAHVEHLLDYLRTNVPAESPLDKPPPITRLDTEDTAALFYKTGTYFWFMGDYERTQELFEISCPIAEKTVGEEHQLTVACYDHLGGINHFRGDHDAAIPYLEKVILINNKKMVKNEEILQEYSEQGKPQDEAYQEVLLEVLQTHASNLMTSNKLARIYHLAKRLDEAYQLIISVIKAQNDFYGEMCEPIADSYQVLSYILEDMGKYSDAEMFLKRVAEFYSKTFQKDHPLIHQVHSHLGLIYTRQGRLEEALNLLEPAYQSLKNYYGENNERVAGTRSNLEFVREMLGRRS